MKNATKTSIIQLMNTVCKGLRALTSVSLMEQLEVLEESQNAVICIGDTIEQEEDYDPELIGMLENFAESLYLLSVLAQQNELTDEAVNKVEDECVSARQELDKRLKGKWEVLFMPYKASMWDSLESVYLAAKNDVDCHAVVMPVPYYNLGPNRVPLSMKYEGDQFPEEIEITDYKQYDLAEKCPDAIFIHNPYDNRNYVTQLPMQYFSSELIKYTEYLVYIPYKVCGGIVGDHYCVMPGVSNAWRVFVQCEEVRKTYVKYQKPEKIITAGSPKTDKVIYYEKNKPAVPAEWGNAFEGRTVFLLNTHLTSLLSQAENMIAKLNEMTELIAERDDIAVLWRPHPLSIETIKAMNPRVEKAYFEVIEKFKKLKNGVYDESSDMHRALALSDAYVGSPQSSLVTLYGITGKPILLLDMNMRLATRNLVERYRDAMRTAVAVTVGDEMFFFARDFNQMFRYDRKSGTVSRAEHMKMNSKGNVQCMFREKEQFIVVVGHPVIKMECCIFSLNGGGETRIQIDGTAAQKNPEYIKWKHRLYMISQVGGEFGYIDLKKGQYRSLAESKKFWGNSKVEKVILVEDSLYFLLDGQQELLQYDILRKIWERLPLPVCSGTIRMLSTDGEKIYLLTDLWELLVCDSLLHVIRKYECLQKMFCSEKYDIQSMIVRDGKIVLIRGEQNHIVLMDEDGIDISILNYPDNIEFDTDLYPQKPRFGSFDYVDGKLILYPNVSDMLLSLDLESKTLNGKKIKWDGDVEWELVNFFNIPIIYSGVYFEQVRGLDAYFDSVEENEDVLQNERKEAFSRVLYNLEGDCGQKIWENVREALLG